MTVAQKTPLDALRKEGKPRNVLRGLAVSKHIHGKFIGWGKCSRKRCTGDRDDCSLDMIVKRRELKNSEELHKEGAEAGVRASRATLHRGYQEIGTGVA